jgi:ribosome-binding protein aMBF1 (putative translation factor)
MDQPLSIPTPEIVRKAAAARGLSINEMSRRAKKHPDLFRRWARGNNASQETIQAWLDVINATPLQPQTDQDTHV